MTEAGWRLSIGARPTTHGVDFRVWSPGATRVDVVVYGPQAERLMPLRAEGEGYFAGSFAEVGTGAHYRYRIDEGASYPDPASRSQPQGIHGPSQVVDPDAFRWTDESWCGRRLEELVIYEVHIGTFTPVGTFDAAIEQLSYLMELGVTAVEVMPIANFPGCRNWGYDGVNLYAPSAAYGDPEAFKRFVDAAHAAGLAVILDVVYNHLGPEGNHLPAITQGRFLTDRHCTPWGDAVNYDGPDSRPVRDFAIHNALYWLDEYHVDGLRLDATHAILDDSTPHILREIAERVHAFPGAPRTVIAEDERNERRVILSIAEGGYGLDAVWADDLHHQLRRLTAGDDEGYFASYGGSVAEVVETIRKGWFYEGQRSPHTGEARGTSSEGIPPQRFVHCIQNHDQVGNRAFGDRLRASVDPSEYRAISALLLFGPHTPLLWMGQEWAATSPFLYFTDHPEELGKLVTAGRREEFGHFSAFADPTLRERIPDPQAVETFESSRLRWEEQIEPVSAGTLELYRAMLRVRATEPAMVRNCGASFGVAAIGDTTLALRRDNDAHALLLLVNFRGEASVDLSIPSELSLDCCEWQTILCTEEERFSGAPASVARDGHRLTITGAAAVVLRAV